MQAESNQRAQRTAADQIGQRMLFDEHGGGTAQNAHHQRSDPEEAALPAPLAKREKQQMNGQAKSVRFAMSHPTGKIVILGKTSDNRMLFKYHQAKYAKDAGRIFVQELEKNQCWLGNIEGGTHNGTVTA